MVWHRLYPVCRGSWIPCLSSEPPLLPLPLNLAPPSHLPFMHPYCSTNYFLCWKPTPSPAVLGAQRGLLARDTLPLLAPSELEPKLSRCKFTSLTNILWCLLVGWWFSSLYQPWNFVRDISKNLINRASLGIAKLEPVCQPRVPIHKPRFTPRYHRASSSVWRKATTCDHDRANLVFCPESAWWSNAQSSQERPSHQTVTQCEHPCQQSDGRADLDEVLLWGPHGIVLSVPCMLCSTLSPFQIDVKRWEPVRTCFWVSTPTALPGWWALICCVNLKLHIGVKCEDFTKGQVEVRSLVLPIIGWMWTSCQTFHFRIGEMAHPGKAFAIQAE